MNDYILLGDYAKERMNELINGPRRVKPFRRIGRANRQSLFSRLRSWWATRDEATPKRQLERAR